MTVTYLIGFDVRPDAVDRFLSLLDGVLDAMRHEAMFRNATLHRDPADPCRFLLHETWADHDDVVAVQLARPYRRAWHEALPDLLTRPREVGIWQPLREDRADSARRDLPG